LGSGYHFIDGIDQSGEEIKKAYGRRRSDDTGRSLYERVVPMGSSAKGPECSHSGPPSFCSICRSAGKVNSPKFAGTAF
jgi:hypothetical protein